MRNSSRFPVGHLVSPGVLLFSELNSIYICRNFYLFDSVTFKEYTGLNRFLPSGCNAVDFRVAVPTTSLAAFTCLDQVRNGSRSCVDLCFCVIV